MAAPSRVQDEQRYHVRLRLPVKLGAKMIKPDHQNIVMTGAVIKQLAVEHKDAFETITEVD